VKRPHPGRPPKYSVDLVPIYYRDEPRIRQALLDRAASEGIPLQALMSNFMRQLLGEPSIDAIHAIRQQD